MPNRIIAVDAMGGDNAPKATCEGALMALREMPDIEIKLYGREDEIKPCLGEYADVADRLEIITDAKYWPFPTYSEMLYYL